MSTLVDKTQIEAIVGAQRHPTVHVARGTATTVYILHPTACVDAHDDLRDCPYSHALDRGIDGPVASMWWRRWDRPVVVTLHKGRLIPHLAATATVTPPVTLHEQESA